MAVARITADRRTLHRLVALAAGERRLERELLRAAERPGLTAEMTGPEILLLADRAPADPVVSAALERYFLAERSERQRRDRTLAARDRAHRRMRA